MASESCAHFPFCFDSQQWQPQGFHLFPEDIGTWNKAHLLGEHLTKQWLCLITVEAVRFLREFLRARKREILPGQDLTNCHLLLCWLSGDSKRVTQEHAFNRTTIRYKIDPYVHTFSPGLLTWYRTPVTQSKLSIGAQSLLASYHLLTDVLFLGASRMYVVLFWDCTCGGCRNMSSPCIRVFRGCRTADHSLHKGDLGESSMVMNGNSAQDDLGNRANISAVVMLV